MIFNPQIFSSSEFQSLSKHGRYMLIYFHARANQSGECWPTITTIRTDTRMKRNTITAAITELQRAGFLKRKKRFSKSTVYKIDSSIVKDTTDIINIAKDTGSSIAKDTGSSIEKDTGSGIAKDTLTGQRTRQGDKAANKASKNPVASLPAAKTPPPPSGSAKIKSHGQNTETETYPDKFKEFLKYYPEFRKGCDDDISWRGSFTEEYLLGVWKQIFDEDSSLDSDDILRATKAYYLKSKIPGGIKRKIFSPEAWLRGKWKPWKVNKYKKKKSVAQNLNESHDNYKAPNSYSVSEEVIHDLS